MFKLFRPIRHLIGSGVWVVLTALCVLLARLLPGFWFSFYTDFSRSAMRFLGTLTGWIPFPLWEVLLVLLVLSIPVGLVLAIKGKRILGWLTALLEGVCLLVFLFVGLWGLNHFAPSLGEQLELEVKSYTLTELKQAARFYTQKASELSDRVERDAAGDPVFPEFSALSDAAVEAYARLGAENPRLQGTVRRAKPLLVSDAFAYMGTTGVFVCLTGEATVSTSAYLLDRPFTICHELGHSLAIAGEDEANYCGFLACRASEDPLLQYSGYYNAFIYCYNALYAESPTAARSLWDLCSDRMIHDANIQVEHNKKYEGKTQTAAQAVNDAHLKLFQEEGIKSYGLVVDYLIADYQRQAG